MSNDEALRSVTEGKAVAMVGNLSDGFISVGPYENFDAAANAHEGDECWIKTLIPPAQWNADSELDPAAERERQEELDVIREEMAD